ncbi:holin family protein [Frigidibacter sp. MR17.24]|uniref:holin family protein n=1 Tax=Frigidibacter sp. MR17.24 TaxID=3127345 RepID=UPI003012AFA5
MLGALFGRPGAAQAAGRAVAGVAEVFVENRTKAMERAASQREAAMAQTRAEFEGPGSVAGPWNRFCNGLNRLPRPLLALSTIGLFAYAMADPAGFTLRMTGLSAVPEPLWWLMGAIVSFYFGAREAHYFRGRAPAGAVPLAVAPVVAPVAAGAGAAPSEGGGAMPVAVISSTATRVAASDNAALAEWLAG